MLIVFEGMDGSGKTTQAELLKTNLELNNYEAILVREPGGTPFAEKIREMIKDPNYKTSPTTDLFLFEAARADLIEKVIKPAIDRNEIVICDRFTLSTIAYQGYICHAAGTSEIAMINYISTDGITPDLTFILNPSFSEIKERLSKKNPDKFESMSLDKLGRVHEFYSNAATVNERKIIDTGNKTIKEVGDYVLSIVLENINKRWCPQHEIERLNEYGIM